MRDHPDFDAFVRDLECEARQYSQWGKRNNLSDVTLTMVSILGSLAAAIIGASKAAPYWAAGCAALPAACTSFQRIVQLRERSFLHFQHAAAIAALATRLKYACEPDLERFALERAQLTIDRENRWTHVVRGGPVKT
jgi:hypothetical protein